MRLIIIHKAMKKSILFFSFILLTLAMTSCSNDDNASISSVDFEKIFQQGGWQESKCYKIESSGQWIDLTGPGIDGWRPLRFAFMDWNLLKLYHEYDYPIHTEDGNFSFEEYEYCNYQFIETTQELTLNNITYHVESISPEKLVIKGKGSYDDNMYVREFKHVSASVVAEWNERFIHEKQKL